MLKFGASKWRFGKSMSKTRKYEDKEEEPEEKESSSLVIVPGSKFHMTWSALLVVVMVHTLTVMPVFLSFSQLFNSLSIQIIEYIVDAIVIADVFVNFVTAVEVQLEDKEGSKR